MCGRLNIMDMPAIDDFLNELNIPLVGRSQYSRARYNVAPTMAIPTLTLVDDHFSINPITWGIDSVFDGKKKILANARAERLFSARMWQSAITAYPAVVLANGFYEWQRNHNDRPAYYVHANEPLLFGALVHTAGNQCNAALITEPASPKFSVIHHRQPLTLDRASWAAWLNDIEYRQYRALHPQTDPAWTWQRVSPLVNQMKNDGPACIAPYQAKIEQVALPGFEES